MACWPARPGCSIQLSRTGGDCSRAAAYRNQSMKNRLLRLVKNDSGATAIEYGMIAGLIAVVIVTTLTLLGPQLEGVFDSISKSLPTAAEG